jgi:hypothetical protein
LRLADFFTACPLISNSLQRAKHRFFVAPKLVSLSNENRRCSTTTDVVPILNFFRTGHPVVAHLNLDECWASLKAQSRDAVAKTYTRVAESLLAIDRRWAGSS